MEQKADMKRNILFYLFIGSALMSCNYNDYIEPENNRVILSATNDSATRVIFDGSKSTWDKGDRLNVTVDGLNDIYEFSYDYNSTNNFICDNLTLPAEENNIYAFYGVQVGDIDVANKSASVQLSATTQTQNVESPTAHIPTYDILYGKAMGVDKNNIQIAMNHTVALVGVNIVNGLQESKNIKSVAVSAPTGTALTGSYIVSPTGVTRDSSANSSNAVTVALSSPTSLAAGAAYKVWAATTPFVVNVGEMLVIDIETDDGEVYHCEKIATSSNLNFAAGRIMSTKVTLGEDALLVATQDAEKISIEFDFDAGGILPADFPDSSDDGINKGTYKICGYDFLFNSPVAFYSNEKDTSYRIRFDSGITNSNHATIKLPTKDGYKISAITLSSIDSNKNKYRDYRFSITDEGGATFNGGEFEILSKEKYTYNLDGTANKDCYIRISHLNSNKNPIDLGYIAITYTKI